MATEVAAARRRIIRRPRLTSILDDSTARIRLLVAPAGYGKTTLAREWLGEAQRREAWYRGGPASADVAALAAGLAEAVSEIVPDAGRRMRDRLRATGQPEEDVEIFAELLAEDVMEWPSDAWLAFDDYQFAMDSVVSERFVDLLAQQTPIQVLITSRRRPSWVTARRILYGEILEIDRRTLAMEDREAREILARQDRAAEELIARAKGWAAVLGLASLTSDLDVPELDLPEALYDYFAEELLQATTPPVQSGLSQLAALGAVSAEFAGDLLGQGAGEILSEGVRIGAVTRQGLDYELHPLLSEFLVAKLNDQPERDVKGLASDAVRLLAGERRWDQAFHVIRALNASHLLPDLLTVALDDLLHKGRTQTVAQWLDLAEVSHVSSPVIDLAAAEIAFREGLYAKAEALARAALSHLDDSDLCAKALIRAGQSAMLDSRDEQALPLFREARNRGKSEYARLEALVGECLTSLELGQASDAEGAFTELAALEGGFETRIRQATVQLVRAARLGGVEVALGFASEVRPLLDNFKDPLIATSFLNAIAHVLVLNARYEEALEVGQAELEVVRQYRLDFALPHALLVRAAAFTGLREFSKASEEMEAADEHTRHGHDIHIASYSACLKARIAIHNHEFEEALTHTAERWERPASHPARAELLAYRGLAAACLGDIAGSEARCAEVHKLASSGIEATALAACARAINALSEDPSNSSVALKAFQVVDTTGAFDSFITAARGNSQFLTAILEALQDPTPVARALGDANDFRLARAAGLALEGPRRGPMRDLTKREREVAGLVARGYTNRMIAQALYISDSTVKVHVRHILDKLGARSRAEVASRVSRVD
jgi:LuxR family transcriptional regulator, maltose regulon positive regulatory protein